MNPLSTLSTSSSVESPQRIDGSRAADPANGTQRSREQQAERNSQPQSGVSASISDSARALAASDLSSTQVVDGSKASSATGAEARRADSDPRGPGSLLDVIA